MKKKKEKGFSSLAKIFLALILSLAFVQMFISYRLATAGKLVADLEVDSERLRVENMRLGENISQKGSLSVVYKKAQGLGFKPVEEIFYLTSEVPVALRH